MGNCASVGGLPSMKKLSGFIAAGAFSRLSIVVIRRLSPPRRPMNPPPPMPQLYGSTTPSTLAAATAASNALPPARMTSIAACVASGSTLAAAPPVPFAVGCFSCAWATGAAASATTHASSHLVLPIRTSSPRESSAPGTLPPQGSGQSHTEDDRGDRLPAALAQAGEVDGVGGGS